MKSILWVLLLLANLVFVHPSTACVGKTLFVGISGSNQEIIFAEIISQLITERTGTTVKIQQFKDSTQLYNAVKKGEVGMMVENLDHALQVLDRKENNSKQAYDLVKQEYRKSLNLVWLEPFGTSLLYAPVVSMDTVGHLPALPKLLNKLSGALTEDNYNKMLKLLKSDEKPRKIARDFLKAKKLI